MVRSKKYKTSEEIRALGQAAEILRDVQGLKWEVIAERIGVSNVPAARFYYEKAKAHRRWKAIEAVKAAALEESATRIEREKAMLSPAKLSFEKVVALAKKTKISVGWIWLYFNGFKYRVPKDLHRKIENGRLPGVKNNNV